MDRKARKEKNQFNKENEAVYNFVKSDHWKLIEDKFMERINDLQSIMNIEGKDADAIFFDMKVRRALIEEMLGIIKDFKGQATQYEQNELSPDERGMSTIIHVDEEDDENV